MYVIVVYDVEERRVSKVNKYLRRYFHWVQNSVFEGEISDRQYHDMLKGLMKIIKPHEDSVMLYKMRSKTSFEKQQIGVVKNTTEMIV